MYNVYVYVSEEEIIEFPYAELLSKETNQFLNV